MLQVVLLDTRSTAENPIKPRLAVIPDCSVASVINEILDENHQLIISRVDTELSKED